MLGGDRSIQLSYGAYGRYADGAMHRLIPAGVHTLFLFYLLFISLSIRRRAAAKNREPLKQRLPAEGAFAAYSITRTRMTLGKCLTSSMTLSATLEPRSTMV